MRSLVLAVSLVAAFHGAAAAKPTRKPAPPAKTPAAPAKPSAAPAKPTAPAAYVLAGIDVFGSSKVDAQDIIAATGLQLGAPTGRNDDAFHASVKAAEAAIKARWDFAFVKASTITYFGGANAGQTFVTIDLVDRGDEARMAFAPAPTGDVADPDGLVAAWMAYEARAFELLDKGELKVGVCAGGLHCALGFGHPSFAGVEQTFIDRVPADFRALCDLLRHDRDGERRAAAAFLLAYGGDRAKVVAALVPSVTDPDAGVRNNVVRVLLEIQHGATEPVIPLDPIVRALRFPETTDRNKAAFALEYLVERAPDRFRDAVLAEVGDVLVAMTAMAQPNNRDPAVAILKALAGKDLGGPAAWRTWVDEQRKMKR